MKRDGKELFPVICCGEVSPGCGGEPQCREEEASADADCAWQRGEVSTPAGPVTRVGTRLRRRDFTGAWKARWGLGRMSYRIPPGLYAVGEPGRQSPVLVSANYKMSFDCLRRELTGLHLWLMVIDTRGINVWCAAGKGTFGSTEIVRRIEKVRLPEIVSHHGIILPQLAAPGVTAHEVFKQSGFRVSYGPVRARDLPAFLQAGCKAAPEMRRVRFGLRERLALAPVELVSLVKPALILLAALVLLNLAAILLEGDSFVPVVLLSRTAADFAPFLGAVLAGTVLVPALLPYIPGRAFAWKGWLLGALWTLAYIFLIAPKTGWIEAAAYFLLLPAIAAFLGMTFTGSSTYTSLSGVVKEMDLALPAIVITAGLGICALIAGRFI